MSAGAHAYEYDIRVAIQHQHAHVVVHVMLCMCMSCVRMRPPTRRYIHTCRTSSSWAEDEVAPECGLHEHALPIDWVRAWEEHVVRHVALVLVQEDVPTSRACTHKCISSERGAEHSLG